MKEVNVDNVQARIAHLETCAQIGGRLSMGHEFELACLRQLLASMEQKPFMYGIADPDGNPHMDEMCVSPTRSSVEDAVSCLNEDNTDVGEALYQVVPLYRHPVNPAPDKYNIGEATMLHIFTATGMTNVSDMHAVFDQVEKALVKLERKPKVIEPDGWRDMITRLANGLELMTSLASERAISVDTCVCLEWVRDARAMLNQEQEPATDNTAQQFEALAGSAQPEIIGYEHRLICGELRRVPKFAGQDIEASSAQREPLAVVKHYTGNTYPTLKFAQDEWSVCGDREDVQELADAINALATSAGSGKP